MTVMRCVIYLRVSTAEQAERDLTEEGFSIPAQREACVRHIRDLGWHLVDEYSDRGESARSADRPQLQAMLRRITEDRDVEAVADGADRAPRQRGHPFRRPPPRRATGRPPAPPGAASGAASRGSCGLARSGRPR